MSAKRWVSLFGAAFLLVGIVGFVPNPLLGGPDAFFATNTPHNLAHLLIGLIMIVTGMQTDRIAFSSMLLFGGVYLLLAAFGFAEIGAEGHAEVMGMVHVNSNDNWLHLVLGTVLVVAAFAKRPRAAVAAVS